MALKLKRVTILYFVSEICILFSVFYSFLPVSGFWALMTFYQVSKTKKGYLPLLT